MATKKCGKGSHEESPIRLSTQHKVASRRWAAHQGRLLSERPTVTARKEVHLFETSRTPSRQLAPDANGLAGAQNLIHTWMVQFVTTGKTMSVYLARCRSAQKSRPNCANRREVSERKFRPSLIEAAETSNVHD